MMNRAAGFTLIELLIVIVVIGISLSLAVPSFQGMVARNTMATQVNDFLLAINLARSEAMRRGSQVTIQSADNGATSSDEFGNGYCVQIGIPGASGYSTSCTYDASKCSPTQTTGCIIREFGTLNGESTLNSIENVSAVSFGSLGELSGGAVRNLDMCNDGAEGRRIHIALVGRSKSMNLDSSNPPSC
jgi:type IV fimbrial biogenesis protein FimT